MKQVFCTTRVYENEVDKQHYQRSFAFCWGDVVGIEDTTEIWEGRYKHVTKININDGEVYHVLEAFDTMAQLWDKYLNAAQAFIPHTFSGN